MAIGKKLLLDTAANETQLEVDGITYTLRYGFDAIAVFEQTSGFNPVTEAFKPTIMNFITLLYVGLMAHHPDIQLDAIKSWFNEKTSKELCIFAWESFYGSLPQPAEATEGEAAPVDPLPA